MKQALKCDFTWADFKTNSDGMVPVVVQDAENDEVLMLAYMNQESLKKTMETGLAVFYSRSRKGLWTKGETSGNFQHVKKILVDCDEDTILLLVDPDGPACHTGHTSCFYRNMEGEEVDE